MAGAQTATVGSLDWPDWLGKEGAGAPSGPQQSLHSEIWFNVGQHR